MASNETKTERNSSLGEKDSTNDHDPRQLESGPKEEEIEYPSTRVVLPIVLSLCLAVFLTSLDRTIIGVAIPAISNDFKSFADISWYESGYLLTFGALNLPMGKFFTFFPAKWAFLVTVTIFEIGSIVCAAAPSSTAFIIGRAIAGIGSAGGITGSNVILADILPLEKRPKYTGFIAATFGLASIAGPLLGGVFTSKVTWRWCFWINVPIGGLALVVLFLLVPLKKPSREFAGTSWTSRLLQFDPIGTVLMITGLILLLLGLQWGGNQYGWSSTRTIVTLVLGCVLIVAFAVSQIFIGDNGTVPPRIMRKRSIAAGAAVSLGFGSTLIIVTFYLPIWYQAIKGISAIASGVRMLAYFLTTVIFVITSGIIVSKTGYYTPWLIAGTALMIVGCGLLSTFSVDTSTGRSIGYQVVTGVGLGFSLAQCNNAAQTVCSREDLPIGLTIINFGNFIGGTIFVSICQGILSSTLRSGLSQSDPNLDTAAIAGSGATNLRSLVSADELPNLLKAYNKGIDNVFYTALGVSAFAFVASWFVEWKSVKGTQSTTEKKEQK